jgi:MoxR-like ATPase
MPQVAICNKCGNAKNVDATNFYRDTKSGGFNTNVCKDCYRASRQSSTPRGPRTQSAKRATTRTVTAGSVSFIASPKLLNLFGAVEAAIADGNDADNVMFLGPSGCGKTTAAKFLAERLSLPFTHVDAAAMTDPESWFGTREVVAVDGVSVTTYHPSAFVEAIQKPGVLLIDEINRVRDEHRNIILPLTDGTRSVTNPLTGERVERHPQCIIIMSGNRGLQFTGTYAVDPALMTRAYVCGFTYLDPEAESQLVIDRWNVEPRVASTFVRLANETRARAAEDPDFIGVSTREVLQAAKLVRYGVSPDEAVAVAILELASDEGGSDSIRESIRKLWIGVRPGLMA